MPFLYSRSLAPPSSFGKTSARGRVRIASSVLTPPSPLHVKARQYVLFQSSVFGSCLSLVCRASWPRQDRLAGGNQGMSLPFLFALTFFRAIVSCSSIWCCRCFSRLLSISSVDRSWSIAFLGASFFFVPPPPNQPIPQFDMLCCCYQYRKASCLRVLLFLSSGPRPCLLFFLALRGGRQDRSDSGVRYYS